MLDLGFSKPIPSGELAKWGACQVGSLPIGELAKWNSA